MNNFFFNSYEGYAVVRNQFHFFNELKKKSFTLKIAQEKLEGNEKVSISISTASLRLLLQLALQMQPQQSRGSFTGFRNTVSSVHGGWEVLKS